MIKSLASGRLERLRSTIEWARTQSRFYGERLAAVDTSVSTEAALLEQIPILERSEIQTLPKWPRSPLACTSVESFVRFHHTSGSSGQGSLWVADTAEDWRAITDAWSVALRLWGVTSADRALVCAAYGRFIGFWGLHDALVDAEALTVSAADLDTVGRVDLIERLGITVVAATPTYALLLAKELRSLEHNVRLVITSGEPRPEATRRRLAQAWSCETFDTAGMTEVGTISMVECRSHRGNLHVIEDGVIEEVLDPVTRKPVEDGQRGVRVVTTLARRGMPFIRYWTNDLVTREPATCDCGIARFVYAGGIQGRTDDMVKIRGVWFLPSFLEDIVRGLHQVQEFRSTVRSDARGLASLEVELELNDSYDATESRDFELMFATECKRRLGFHPSVTICAPNTLPRFEMKSRRFHDLRNESSAQPDMGAPAAQQLL
jgi:phenylacetate-coenzyme A ligase PaaK-like adenylate-forming protein